MGLATYQEKRNFRVTSEPKGKRKKTSPQLSFVVQQHAASHLHYDFRLEMEGVLKSWAIPKGPSMNPSDKRLAIMVEDHPYDYRNFEGTIPEGNYGAGKVIVWDNGTYHDLNAEEGKSGEKQLLEGLKKGKITFILHGKKLKGEFSLVRMKAKQKNAWLLIKKEDKFSTDENILKKNKSVKSNKIIEGIDTVSSKKKVRVKSVKTEKKAAPPLRKKKAILKLLKPMLAETSDTSFDSGDWLNEIKFDGYRAVANINKGSVELYSRNLLPFNEKYPAIVSELEKIAHTVILDGEIVVEDKEGKSGFQLLQNRQGGKLKYYVFDLLHLNGYDLYDVPLIERKNLLKILITESHLKNVLFSKHVVGNGVKFYKDAVKNQMEGIISKEIHSRYRPGTRSKDWLKIKIQQQQEMVIVGITKPKGSRKHFGALLLALYEKGQWKYAGHCGTGFSQQTLAGLYKKFKPLFTDRSPFKEKVRLNDAVQWMRPEIVCEIKFTEWTAEGSLRHPVFMGLREDKKANEVKREKPTIAIMKNHNKIIEKRIPSTVKEKKEKEIPVKEKKPARNKSADEKEESDTENEYDLRVGRTTLHLTNQHKIYWPKEKYMKKDLIEYYDQAAEFILPYLKDRPESMHRFPNGINKPSFYQKDVDKEKVPDWLKTEKIYSESNKKHIDYLVCNDKATLIYMANLGCIEMNPWNSRIGKIEYPDWVVIDLDPQNIDFKEVVRTALAVKETLDELEVDCYCKTSGASGMHIYIPLGAKYDYETARTFAELIAGLAHTRLPNITSIVRSPAQRKRKVYLDFLQNSRGQTLAAPYAVRPQPGATVSTPLLWKEVNEKLHPSQFTIKNIFKRLDKVGDLWKPVIGKGENISKALKKLQEMSEA